MLKVSFNRSHPLTLRSISHLEESEAADLLRTTRNSQPRKSISREEHLIVRNGVLRKLEPSELPFQTQETKIVAEFQLHLPADRPPVDMEERQRSKDVFAEATYGGRAARSIEEAGRWLDDFSEREGENELREELCRVWYQKMAMEAALNALQSEARGREDTIAHLRQDMDFKGQMPFPSPFPLSRPTPNYGTFTLQNSTPVHSAYNYGNRTFQQSNIRNF